MTTHQQHRRRAVRVLSAIVGLTFLTIVLLGPAIGGLITN
jgi:predicted membrane protein